MFNILAQWMHSVRDSVTVWCVKAVNEKRRRLFDHVIGQSLQDKYQTKNRKWSPTWSNSIQNYSETGVIIWKAFLSWVVNSWNIVYSKPTSLEQIKKVVELYGRNVTRDLIKASEKKTPYVNRMMRDTLNTLLNSCMISFVKKTSHKMVKINVFKRT